MSVDAVQYRGRKTRRSGSEQRRKAILEAALRIVVREGVRGVRHRAVAKEADVPLSATTYYFKDISDLITDTFTLFAEQSLQQVVDPFEAQINEYLEGKDLTRIDDEEYRKQVILDLASSVAALIYSELTDKREHLLAEQAFFHEAVRDPRLRELAMSYRENLLQGGLIKVCQLYGSPDPNFDAQMLLTIILNMETEGLMLPPEEIKLEDISKKLDYIFTTLVNNSLIVNEQVTV